MKEDRNGQHGARGGGDQQWVGGGRWRYRWARWRCVRAQVRAAQHPGGPSAGTHIGQPNVHEQAGPVYAGAQA